MSVSKKYNKWTSKYQERGPVYRIIGLYCKIDIDIICFLCYIISAVRKTVCGLVAQLDRVFDYESKGRGFESRRAHFPGSLVNKGFRGFSFSELTEELQE